MMSMQELFYGDREPTWIIPSYQDVPRLYHDPRVYPEDVSPRTHKQYHQRTYVRPESPPRIDEEIPQFAETRYMGPPVIELKVPMCCSKCEEKVKEALLEMEGVTGVTCDQFNQRVTITGDVDPLRALKRVRRIKKRSELMRQPAYSPYSPQPYSQTFDSAKSYRHHGESSRVHSYRYEEPRAYSQEYYNTAGALPLSYNQYRRY